MTCALTNSSFRILAQNPRFIITVAVSTPVCILNYACLDGIYFCLKYPGVQPKTEAMPPFELHLYTPTTSAYIGFGPIHIPDQASLIIWVQCVLPFMPVRKLNHEWLVISISR
jgi:hypothetical protein